MGRGKSRLLAVGGATLLAAIPLALGFRRGAEPGYSGGSFWGGQNCTACHPFNAGTGYVEILDAPQRYRPNAMYDIRVRTMDPTMDGAGFQLSAEGFFTHEGSLHIIDAELTQYAAPNVTSYVTHTEDGVDDSMASWAANGGYYDYAVRWQAPSDDVGMVTFFAAANAVNAQGGFGAVKFYAAQEISRFAWPGDADGDDDRDLGDFAALQRCFDGTMPAEDESCLFNDMNHDGWVALADVTAFVQQLNGPTATDSAGFLLADPVRGGLLYDRWWAVTGAPAPTGNHPLWAIRPDQVSNSATGAATWRCKECHGWDYKGVDGQYGGGSHRTGFGGVFGTTLSPKAIFDLLKADPVDVLNGHDMDAVGMTDRDIWDVANFVREAVVDSGAYINSTGQFLGDPDLGYQSFESTCSTCHGSDGDAINFGTALDPVFVGTAANQNPWEFLHKVRFGHPGSPMTSGERILWTDDQFRDASAWAATLPQ